MGSITLISKNIISLFFFGTLNIIDLPLLLLVRAYIIVNKLLCYLLNSVLH